MEFEKLRPEEVCDLDGQWMLFCPVDCLLEIKGIIPKSCFGAVFPGVIFKGKVYTNRVLATSFEFEVNVFRGDNLKNVDSRTLLVLADGISEKAEEVLERAFIKYGAITYLGGGAGSLDGNIDCLFDSNGFFRENCLFVPLPPEMDIRVRHGWRPTQFEFITTKTEGRKVIELDWKPAFRMYRETLERMGVDVSVDDFFGAASGYPFGLRRLEGEMIVRDPLYVDGEAIVCAGRVGQHCIVSLMYGNEDTLLSAARESAEHGGVIVFDCVSRALYLGKSFERELRLFKKMSGALTIGEIAAKKAYPEFYNKTVVVGIER